MCECNFPAHLGIHTSNMEPNFLLTKTRAGGRVTGEYTIILAAEPRLISRVISNDYPLRGRPALLTIRTGGEVDNARDGWMEAPLLQNYITPAYRL